MGSVSKKAKKELPVDSGCGGSETESELPTEDDSKYPDDLEDKMKGGTGVGGWDCSTERHLLCSRTKLIYI